MIHILYKIKCESNQTYKELKPIQELTIIPDAYLKIIFIVQEQKIIRYFMTGLWIRENNFRSPPNSINYDYRLIAAVLILATSVTGEISGLLIAGRLILGGLAVVIFSFRIRKMKK